MGFRWERWTLSNLMPVLFVIGVIFIIWWIYAKHHLMYLFQINIARDSTEFDAAAYRRGQIELYINMTLTGMLVTCFLCCIFVDAGSVPDEPYWINGPEPEPEHQEVETENSPAGTVATFPLLDADSEGLASRRTQKAKGKDSEASATLPIAARSAGGNESTIEASSVLPASPLVREEKCSGGRRFCKWCSKYKPDRVHHCRICKSCVLRMDHHCPWIANCVGYRNHKYFLLLVFYAVLNSHFIVYTLSESVSRVLVEETTFEVRAQVIFGMTLASMMVFIVTAFLAFHVWLVTRNTTTIEFCEKRLLRPENRGYSSYDIGPMENIKSVLGRRPWLWWLPLDAPSSDGLRFSVSQEEVMFKSPESKKPKKGGPQSDSHSDSSEGWIKESTSRDGERERDMAPECSGATPEWTGARAAAA